MSSFPGSPRLVRGGLVLIDPTSAAIKRMIVLQYNPDSLTRTLQVQALGESGDRSQALRIKGPPVETIKVEAEIDATDAMEGNDAQTNQAGLHPQLAALETIVYPQSAHLLANNAEASGGSLEIAPELAPLPLFVFGPKRIVPVRITEMSIVEEAFDAALNPLRAKLGLTLRVLTVDDLGFDNKGGNIFMAYLRNKEQLAARYKAGTLAALGVTGLP